LVSGCSFGTWELTLAQQPPHSMDSISLPSTTQFLIVVGMLKSVNL